MTEREGGREREREGWGEGGGGGGGEGEEGGEARGGMAGSPHAGRATFLSANVELAEHPPVRGLILTRAFHVQDCCGMK